MDPDHETVHKTVVITGASSGIGRETALAFAQSGYNVVLAARRATALEDTRQACQAKGAAAVALVTDVTDELAVMQLASTAVERFGAIDLWVNGAGVTAYGKFLDIPAADFRRVIDTNLLGYVHGSRAALARFREQGYGTLINIVSVNAVAPVPYASAYIASKYALRGLGEALRIELQTEGLGETIKICNVMPASTDTNLFQNAANYMRRPVLAVEPVYDPALVAAKIVRLADQPRRELFIGGAGIGLVLQRVLAPHLYDRLVGQYINHNAFGSGPAVDSAGNLYEPREANTGSRGGWRERRITNTNVAVAGGVLAAAAIGLAAAGWLALRRNRSR